MFQFVLKRLITRHQLFGAFLIVISLTIAEMPALLKDFSTDEASFRKAALVAASSSNSSNPTEVPAAADTQQTSAVNALPIQALVLALIAACISG